MQVYLHMQPLYLLHHLKEASEKYLGGGWFAGGVRRTYPVPRHGHGAAGAPVLGGGVVHVHPVAVVRRPRRCVATPDRVE